MNELLSADELSDLLEAVSEGQPGGAPGGPAARERSIQALDFRAPGLLSREQLRLLQQLHDAAAVAFSCTLSDAVSAPVEVTVASVDAVAFGAFSNALPASACIQTFRADPGGHRGLLCLDMPLAFGIIERLLGGRGQALEQLRPLTAVEQAVAVGPLEALLERLAAAWATVAPVELRPEALAMSPQSAQVLGGREVVLQVLFAIGGDVCVGDLSLCLPLSFVEQLLPGRGALGRGAADPEALHALRQAVGAAPVRVAAELGRADISVLDLLGLQPGHVIRLDRRTDDPLDVTVERTPYLAGRPGLVGHTLAIQITDDPPRARKGAAQP